ncbi:MAG: gamma carbonic anhydrase family protein [Metallosphaera yellowstonensis]|jgi:Carbonic anhydrases/acetyltransferases, isoleucine patch superfamily|uniref:Isoleucine patch superfamily enzyme, carbonic anhydrase/acetyltransferase n=1 Tax=Metallosphaera yellowstonensis MK1 TaxID=671065 RepID=H2C831_9CREN|nr:gamma carbonic anhydrase family protein [Metallosphaera yellowstonensis]EHP68307.1 isoleucine patch superfamily enzyme, carbonic anhydrase/acetyltransferase [Metallosphaera yellowstonensis MK1]
MPIEEFMGRKPKVSTTSFIHQTAYIIGDVEIGDLSSVWHYAVIRGDNEKIVIGRKSNIQENSSIHTDKGYAVEIGDRVSIGHNAIVHGAKVGSNVIIGMGAILLNGAKVGDNCIIGAGAVVTEGKEIPPYSLALGVPAKVVRRLNEADIEAIINNAEEYVQLSLRFVKPGN